MSNYESEAARVSSQDIEAAREGNYNSEVARVSSQECEAAREGNYESDVARVSNLDGFHFLFFVLERNTFLTMSFPLLLPVFPPPMIILSP